MMFGFGVWVLYFIDTALLLVIHIPHTQKWARGFTEPSRYGCVCEFIKLNEVTVVEIFHGDIFLYFMYSALLVIIHIPHTQKWALPFPCSKTKSKISFSLGWAQEGLHRTVALRRCFPFYTKSPQI